MDESVDCFSPLAAGIAPSGIMRASSQQGGFQVNSSLISPSTVSEVCSIFSNRVLSSISGSHLGAVVVVDVVLWRSLRFP